MMFNALVVSKDEEGHTSSAVTQISMDDLPDGEVIVAVEYSTVNWKDGACMGSGGGMVRNYPHVPGVDFSGTVESSTDPRYNQGDKVILTGWRVGEAYWGGYSQKASVKADWLVPLPSGLTTKQAMAVGTAGFSALRLPHRQWPHHRQAQGREGPGSTGHPSYATAVQRRRRWKSRLP